MSHPGPGCVLYGKVGPEDVDGLELHVAARALEPVAGPALDAEGVVVALEVAPQPGAALDEDLPAALVGARHVVDVVLPALKSK